MKVRYSKTFVAAALATALIGCGGGNQDAGDVVGEGAADVAGAASDAVDEAGALLDDAGEEVAGAADEVVEGADAMAATAEGGWTDLQANWQESVGSIQAKWGELSAEDLMSTGGDREQLVALIQDKYNLGADEAEQQVSDWEATL